MRSTWSGNVEEGLSGLMASRAVDDGRSCAASRRRASTDRRACTCPIGQALAAVEVGERGSRAGGAADLAVKSLAPLRTCPSRRRGDIIGTVQPMRPPLARSTQ
jgi:hypothetical protein